MAEQPTRSKKGPKWLVFVDTNILLDFYRLGGESAKRTLATLEKHQDSLILTDQVWMEFLKNRQKVIIDAMKQIPKPASTNLPSLMSEFKATKAFVNRQKDAAKQHARAIEAIENLLKRPSAGDIVYRSLTRIFSSNSKCNLKRPNKLRYTVRRLARKRFALGYPPRKDDTLRFGDAINWEWIVHCAQSSRDKCNVVIVSRDGDFGASHNNEAFVNDWLRVEFRDRVSMQRKIELTHKLSTALKKLDVAVTAKDVAEEDRIVRASPIRVENRIGEERELFLQELVQKWLAVANAKVDKEKE